MSVHDNSGAGFLSDEEEALIADAEKVVGERRDAGIEGLVGGLDSVIIATATDRLVPAVYELLRYTGLSCTESFFHEEAQAYILGVPDSPSVIVRSRQGDKNPFARANRGLLTGSCPDTRLETLVFSTSDLREYLAIQKARGVRFLTREPLESDLFSFIQTEPSAYTGNSLGFIEWYDDVRSYVPAGATAVFPDLEKPAFCHLSNISVLDHAATRVRARDRSAAILEFLWLTNYHYDFAVHVRSLNSITSVARREPADFAMVFTSGITPFSEDRESGPTEKFIRNYGTRVHHVAFRTREIERTVAALGQDGLEFLLGLVGSEEEGLKQIFSEPSKNTLLVTEYIHRYGGFDGFFSRSNVEKLTSATGRQ
jgi:hypothetical protein